MTGRLEGKVAVITGAASGIGAGTVRMFVDHGAKVIVADLQEAAGRALVAELGDSTRFSLCDVTRERDVAAAVDMAVAEFGRLDIMFNNAGIIGAVGRISEMPVEAWDNTINIVLRGVFLGVKHAARVMMQQGSGVIINTSSTAGIVGGLGPHAYTAAKHGVIGLTKSAANELAPFAIRVNAISPGNTVTAMTASIRGGSPDDLEATNERIAAMSPLGYAGLPEDIAAAALYLASDDARCVTGHTLVVDCGQTTSGMTPNKIHTGSSKQIHEAGRTT
jgi:NAD(P)-dependent dehydrogenase (short-subunit alcohol dehydrogenase family)